MEKKRTQFSGKIGFILAAAGSAVGLGNIWRFPYLAAEYGGGTFLFFYILFAITFGFSLMIAEVALGRKTGRGVVGTFQSLDKRFTFMGWLTMLVPILTLPYYSVTGGWVMHYGMLFLTGQGAKTAETGFFQSFSANPLWPVFWLCIFVAISCIIVMFGVKKGIERTSKIFLPILIVLNIAIAIYVMTLPGALDGVLYYITPDFSKLSFGTIIAALGQLFYSMSLAMGIMFTYGSYLNKKENLEASVRHIELFDTGIAFLSGLMILPAVFVFSGGDANVLNSVPSFIYHNAPSIYEHAVWASGRSSLLHSGIFCSIDFSYFVCRNHCFRISGSIWVEANPYLHRYLFWSHCNWFGCCLGIWLVEWSYYIWNEHLRFWTFSQTVF